MNRIITAGLVVAILIIAGLQFVHDRQTPPVASAQPVPLPKPKPRLMRAPVHKPAAKAVAVDCSLVAQAKQFYSKDALRDLAASHPAQAQAARACQ